MTKQCSENLVSHEAHRLPAGIFRPPVVLPTYKEPVPGWTGVEAFFIFAYISVMRKKYNVDNDYLPKTREIIGNATH